MSGITWGQVLDAEKKLSNILKQKLWLIMIEGIFTIMVREEL